MKLESGLDEFGFPIVRASEGDKVVGVLEYTEKPAENRIHIGTIQVNDTDKHRRGIGTALVRKFADTVGPNRDVIADISNDPTYEALTGMGIFQFASQRDRTLLIGTLEVFRELPVIKVLGRGGIDILSMEIINRERQPGFANMKFMDDFDRFAITFKGRTRA